MAQIQFRFNKNDEYLTPAYAVYPLIKRLRAGSTIWCPFDEADSQYVKVFRRYGFAVIHSHINEGQDFFAMDVPECDYIISNPPYSLKHRVIMRLYEIGKPFAMLINFQGIFDHRERFEIFRKKRVEMLWLSPRVNFSSKNNSTTTNAPFQSGYLCCGICSKQLEFEYLDLKQKNNYSANCPG